ncbi:cytochrome P450 [Spongiibacter sp. KMU-166]|uniref:Cytochrome P450 n=2 Tax=Spongiibacter thalassae TaxID=2721624 RepID=A0ABX1G9S1_9GAMM|nr:cytochrome P450 [Spongiibacter thalassae]
MGHEDTMYALFDHLRENDPVSWVEHPDYRPFWNLTRYDDIKSIGNNNREFLSSPRTILAPVEMEQQLEAQFGNKNGLDTLIHMDEPKHLKMRRVTRDWFLPRSINKLDAEVQDLSREYVDKMQACGGQCDFIKDLTLLYPLRVIMSILGLPRESEATMLKLTQEIFGPDDPDLQRDPGQVQQDSLGTLTDFSNYFKGVIEERRKRPADDLASVLANAEVDGEPMSELDQLSYFIIAASAGHDTTAAVLGVGMKALLDNPQQLVKWRDNPDLDDRAAKELMRWVSPVRHMVRTATYDLELHGKQIKAGDNLVLWFPAANRDPRAFDNPNKLDITRDPKKHLAFGYGAHMCLGMHLAVLEVARFYRELLPRLKHIELAGEPKWIHANFVGGLKSLPVRYEFN